MTEMAAMLVRLSPVQQAWQERGAGADAKFRARLRVRGASGPGALLRALVEVAERHEILRSRPHLRDGAPEGLEILPPGQCSLHLAIEPRQDGAEAYTVELEAPGLVFDAGALAALLPAWVRVLGGEPEPEELPLQHAEVSEWLHQLLAEDGEGRAFWQERLRRLPPAAALPELLEGGAERGRRSFERTLEPVLVGRLEGLAKRLGRSLEELLLAAFAALLGRLGEGRAFALEVLCGGRSYPELEPLPLPLARALPLAVGAQRGLGLPALAASLARQRAELEAWLEYHPGAGGSRDLFAYHRLAPVEGRGGLEILPLELRTEVPAARLVCTVLAAGDAVRLRLEGELEDLGEAGLARLPGQLLALLEHAARAPEAALERLAWLSPAERHQLLSEHNDTAEPYPGDRRLEALVAEVARRFPERIAVEDAAEQLSYGELLRRSAALAARLAELGPEPDRPLAVMLERGVEVAVALLGIWQAGAPYLPLDPSYPLDRLATMLEDSAARVVLTRTELFAPLAPRFQGTVLALDREALRGAEGAPARPGATSDHLAYVIYTSGSTGRPKGVMIPHRAIGNRLAWMAARFGFGDGDRVLQKTPLGFDASVWELFSPLLAGARLVFSAPGAHRDVEALAAEVARFQVTVLQLVPSLLAAFLAETEPALGASLTRVFCGGEALPGESAARLASRYRARLQNLYGPTETAIDATSGPAAGFEQAAIVPIGRPLSNLAAHVVDRRLELLPWGLAGELLVGGPSLARGYLGRPGETAERFVPDPFGPEPGARLYRTGDRVRRRPDGVLEFRGRLDEQVKIRGFRVEPAEAEAALARHPEVAAAAVVARPDRHGEAQLVAYWVPLPDSRPEPAGLRGFLRERLPEQLVPAAWVELAELPRGPGGKVDRARLPAPEEAAAEPRRALPDSPLHQLLAQIWAEVLEREEIGLDDDFFELGGHSLSATRVASRIRQALGVELALAEVFDHSRFSELAEQVAGRLRREAAGAPPPLAAGPRPASVPLSFAQERLWFLHELTGGGAALNNATALALRGELVFGALERALAQAVARHEVLRTVYRVEDGQPRQVVEAPSRLPLPLIDLSGLGEEAAEAEARALAPAEARRPFSLAAGPVLRLSLLRLGERSHRALLTLHHIASDGWSLAILVEEVAAGYRASLAKEPRRAAPLPLQYADFALWQRSWLDAAELRRQGDFWQEELAGAPPALELPTDRPRAPLRAAGGGRVRFALPAALEAGLGRFARGLGATPFMVLLGGFGLLLARLAGRRQVVVGTPVAGRGRPELEGLIGCFVNTLPLRVRLEGSPGFSALVARLRQTVLAAHAHQDLPFEQLVEALALPRDLSRTPVFQVLFALQNQPQGRIELPGLAIETVETGKGEVNFDLVLSLAQAAGGGFAGAFNYSTQLFDRVTVERWARWLEQLLAAALEAPERPVWRLPWWSPAEQDQLLLAGPPAATLEAGASSPLELFLAAERRCPERVAISFASEHWSYGAIRGRAGRVAAGLLRRGVRAETVVAVCRERSPELVVAILGVLAAAGAWVPLDPAWPLLRLAELLEELGEPWLLTGREERGRLPEGARALEVAALEAEAEEPFFAGAGAAGLAYVIYTSGSTGKPKGVMVGRGSAANLALSQVAAFGLGPEERLLQFAATTFDASVSELFTTFAVAGTLVMARRETLAAAEALAELLALEAITTVTLPPSLLARLGEPELPHLARLVVAGEACPAPLAERWSRGRSLINAYGPTETTVGATAARYRPELGGAPALGGPTAGYRLYLLDAHGELAPPGTLAEVAIAGAGVARGYWRRPGATAERFRPDPWSPEPGARLYLTGDLARLGVDSRLDLAGRADGQVKVAGIRIELGEIEATLERIPGVERAAVELVAENREPGLVAFVALAADAPGESELRQELARRLPRALVPARLVLRERLPLTAHGKVDRRALRELLEPSAPSAQAEPKADQRPRNALERYLLELWEEVLERRGELGREADFFALGGNSIEAAVLVNRLQEALGCHVYVVALFEAPTLEALAEYLVRHYPVEVEQRFGLATPASEEAEFELEELHLEDLKSRLPPVHSSARERVEEPLVFVLAPPRSGSTLLRVMLGGHPHLFAPPELDLLSFADMAERRAAFSGRFAFWREGLARALMELLGEEAAVVEARLEALEEAAEPVAEVYRWLARVSAPRRLVDKTPAYTLDLAILERMEAEFRQPRYLRLLRHPAAVARSFEEAKLDQTFFRQPQPYGARRLGELVWVLAQRNIERFLAGVPPGRQLTVRFEELVKRPREVMEEVAGFLGLAFDEGMLEPYEDKKTRMTDGIHPLSKMLGDVKFHQHAGIDPEAAERWRAEAASGRLSAITWREAARLGYGAPAAGGGIAPLPRDGRPLPLSFAQQRLWFLQQLEPASPAYNIANAVRFRGPLGVAHLASAFDRLRQRHEVLRTAFPAERGRPRLCVQAASRQPLPLVDLGALPASEATALAKSLARQLAARPFDLSRGPLLRPVLLRLGVGDHALALSVHHVVSDGWSAAVLVRELTELYRAAATGKPAELPALPVQYADFAAWQRQRLSGEAFEAELAWWRAQLSPLPPPLELPVDRPRGPSSSGRGSRLRFRLGGESSERVRAFGRARGATPFAVLMAAFQALLYRYTGQQDLTVGTPVAGRTRGEVEGLIGCFVNTLVVRGDLAGAPSFERLVARTAERARGALAHQEVPFELLVEQLQPERELARTPLFQVVFGLQVALPEPQGWLEGGLAVEPWGAETDTAKFDWTLMLAEGAEGFLGWLEYRSDLFEVASMGRLLGHLKTLLEGGLAEPGRAVSRLPLLTAAELEQLRAPRPAAAPVPGGDLAGRFTAAALEAPEAVALSVGEERWSYGALERASAALAAELVALGVGPEVRVGLVFERSAELILALLATARAGGAYVPIDPEYPQERRAFLLADSGARLLLAAPSAAPADAGIPTLAVGFDRLSSRPAVASSSAEPGGPLSPEATAYVIYTSGSTGKPKGVMVSHANVVRLFEATEPWFRFGPGEVWSLFHSYAFDFSVWEIWGALLYGGRLVVVPHAVSRDPERFLDLLEQERVSFLNQTPSAFYQLLWAASARPEGAALALAWVVFGGEALDLASLAPWFRRPLSAARLVNMYGITETTVHVTYRPVSAEDLGDRARSPLGVPIPDLELHLLDGLGQPVPQGIAGELWVAGAGVARGYLGRPGLTAARFSPDPFSGRPGARCYRSGDLARRLVNGELEYLGRADQQLKVRGFRIEPGEIEAVLEALSGVRQAIVLARQEAGRAPRLVAYYVAEPGAAPTVSELARACRARLPEHMVPAAWVALERLPLTAHGKIDRAALPAPGDSEPAASEAWEPPSSPLEEVLAGLFHQVLGVARVGRKEGFFALGGDSLSSVEVVARARELGLQLALAELFELQNVAALAARLAEREAAAEAPAEPLAPFALLSPADRARLPATAEDAYPLTLLQLGMLYHREQGGGEALYHNVNSVHLSARWLPDAFERALSRVVARHPVLRTSFHLGGFDQPLQVVHRAARPALAVFDLGGLAPDEQEQELCLYLEAERARPFELEEPPLLRFALHRRSEESFQLTLTECHAILDGWSLHSLLVELWNDAFELAGGAELPARPAPRSRFAEFVAAEQRALASSETAAFWQAELAGSTALDLARWPGEPEQGVVTESFVLDRDQLRRLRSLAQGAGVPLKSVLLAAHLRLLQALSGARDLATGVSSHGRAEELGSSEACGLFVAILPLRLAPAGGSWLDLARQVFAAERRILPHRRFPLAAMRAEGGERPRLEVLFNYLHFHVLQGFRHGEEMAQLGSRRAERTEFALAVHCVADVAGEQLKVALDCDLARISRAQASFAREVLKAILEDAMARPEARWERPGALPAALARPLAEPALGGCRQPAGRSLVEEFRQRARLAPEAIALDFPSGALSYGALDHRSDRLAARLAELGAGAEVPVGVLLPRSAELVISMLAIVKAGAAYVPLDPDYPAERLGLMVADCRCPLVIAQGEESARLPAGTRVVDPAEEPRTAGSPLPPCPLAGTDALAYVIYTSGSTGRPKGVRVLESGILQLVLDTNYIQFGPGDRVAQSASPSFDAATFEIWGALLNGARLLGLDRETTVSPEQLGAWLARERPTVLFLTTSVFHRMAADAPGVFGGLDSLVVGGEAMETRWAERVLGENPPRRLVNGYGPTETTTFASYHVVEPGAPGGRIVPIGRALAGAWLEVMDPYSQPVLPGAAGELWIGGGGVARDYLGRPGATAERFVPDPTGRAPGARCYRTGDRVRRRPDGVLEYLGRLDGQVKIRGFRIEPGEVEAALAREPGVGQAVVVAQVDAELGRRLVAYVTASSEAPLEPARLRAALAERLPAYLVPAVIVPLAALPLNANGKVDRARLPAPVAPSQPSGEAKRRALTAELLEGIWAQLLGMSEVPPGAGFFDLGGDSLSATRVVARVREVFGVELPLPRVFEAPGVDELAEEVERLRAELEGEALAPIRAGDPAERSSPLSSQQWRLWFFDQLHPGSPAYNIPAVVKLVGKLVPEALTAALAGLLERHRVLSTGFLEVASEPRAQWLPGLRLVAPLIDLSGLAELDRSAQAAALTEREVARPFELSRPPLLRCRLVRLGEREHRGLLSLHHIAGDGWSMSVLIRELGSLYTARLEGRQASPGALPVQYGDYARWQREQIESGRFQAQLEAWRRELAGLEELRLPGELGSSPAGDLAAESIPVRLPLGEWQRLREHCRAQGVTPFMLLVAAFSLLLYRHTGQRDQAIATAVANRDRAEIEPLIGFFVNTLILRCRLDGLMPFPAFLAEVRRTTLAAFGRQDTPFEAVVEAVAQDRGPEAPLARAVFVFQNALEGSLQMPGLELEVLSPGRHWARMDLELHLRPVPQGLVGALVYRRAVVSAATAAGLARRLERLLRELAENPERALVDLPLGEEVEAAEEAEPAPGALEKFEFEL